MPAGDCSLGCARGSLLAIERARSGLAGICPPELGREGSVAGLCPPGFGRSGLLARAACRDYLPDFVRLGLLAGVVCPVDLASRQGLPARARSPAPAFGGLPARACSVKYCPPGNARQGSPLGRLSRGRARSESQQYLSFLFTTSAALLGSGMPQDFMSYSIIS